MPHSVIARHEFRPPGVALDLIRADSEDRIEALLPLRRQRMSVDPFAFYRATANVMARDLGDDPATVGLAAQICGDAHLSNFGLFASPERRQVMDLNDFDETIVGPFEYDLKRMVTSAVLAARVNGLPAAAGDDAVVDAVLTYCQVVKALAKLPAIQAWSANFDRRLAEKIKIGQLMGVLERARDKAARNDSARVVVKMADTGGDDWHFTDDPPILTRLVGDERTSVLAGLRRYPASLDASRALLQYRYTVQDVAFRVVGVGSVGTRAYLALSRDSGDDAFVLQIKESTPSAFAGDHRCHQAIKGSHAQQVVYGQRVMQTVGDPMLGFTEIEGRSFLVRTFRDLKGSVDIAGLGPHQLDDYARLCAALLARAHVRSLEPHVLWGYLGKGDELALALTRYANEYADQAESDFEAFTKS